MNKNLHRYAIVVACLTFLLVIAGGLVTSTGSSLAVPDWPLSFGQFFPKMEGGVFYEHGHRMIAGAVAILTLILVIWLWRSEPRRFVRYLGLAAIAAVLIQATLGGITVLYKLPAPVSIAHATLGQIFFCLVVSIAVMTSFPESLGRGEKWTKVQRLGVLTLTFIVLQLIAGATIRHTGKGLHAHLAGAALVVIHIQLLARRVLQTYSFRSSVGKVAAAMPVLVAIQLVLGYLSWRTGPVYATTAHVAIGALLLAATASITLISFRKAGGQP
jgi:cytochrome c oxidase assembly protein subunit 15